MKLARLAPPLIAVTLLATAGAAGYATRDRWLPLLQPPASMPEEPHDDHEPHDAATPTTIVVNPTAQANLGVSAKPVKAGTYWKTITVPGMVVDRPGQSDRVVTAPFTGVVTGIRRLPGDAARPGDELFTIRVLSETLHQTQTELFKATQDITLAEAKRARLAVAGGAVSEAMVIEADNQITRLKVAANAYRQELLSRGFAAAQIDAAAAGTFAREVTVPAPPRVGNESAEGGPPPYEVQELKADLGQQVQAGQTLCLLASHRNLAIEGHAFRDETPLLERSVREGWPVEVDFREEASDWPTLDQEFHVTYLSNTIDPASRTFAFRMPLENQSRAVETPSGVRTLWRFRPGQRVRLRVRVERLDDVFVIPADAVARDGPDSFVFTQDEETFTRRPVRVLFRDRRDAVLADTGAIPRGSDVVLSGAALLNRLAQAAGDGPPAGYHIHADGSVHQNE